MFNIYKIQQGPMSTVVLDTKSITTDAFAGLSSSGVTYTTSTVTWINVASTNATFRIVEASATSDEIIVAAGATGSYTATTLAHGTAHTFTLERYEVDTWIQQTSSTSGLDYVESTTFSSTMSLATGSSSSNVTFSDPGLTGSEYSLKHYVTGSTDVSTSSVETNTHASTISGLEQGVSYTVELYVTEGGADYLLDTSAFTTSAAAAMVLTGPFASYVQLDWSASTDGQGSNYRITNRVDSVDDVLVASSTATEATIQDLTPGNSYTFVLQREELDATWSDQSEISTTALTTSLSIASVASKTIEVSWSNLYAGAEFELFYNGTANGKTTDLTSILRDLSPSTAYELELVIYELGEVVGLTTLGLTTNDSFLKGSNVAIIVGIIIAIVAAIIGMKMM